MLFENENPLFKKCSLGIFAHPILDPEDRLTEVRDGSDQLIASYYYDPFGRRLWKEVDGARTYFLYSSEGLIGEYDATGTEIKTYGWVPDGMWGTDPLFLKTGGTYYWYRNDIQGAPQKLIRTNGSTAWSATYDSFGNCQVDLAAIENNFRLPGQYYDAETGLYYNWSRYYDPTIGRYLRADPFGDGINLYSYVYNNPIGLIDPLGLCAVKKAWDWWSDLVTPDYEAPPIPDPEPEIFHPIPPRLYVNSVITSNYDGKWGPGMTGYVELKWVNAGKTVFTKVNYIKWGEKNSTSPSNYEYPTMPGAYPIKESPEGAKYAIWIDSPNEDLIRYHGGYVSEGCITYGKSTKGAQIEKEIISNLGKDIKMTAILTVKDNRSAADKKTRPIPY